MGICNVVLLSRPARGNVANEIRLQIARHLHSTTSFSEHFYVISTALAYFLSSVARDPFTLVEVSWASDDTRIFIMPD